MAVRRARSNARALGLERVSVLEGDLLEPLPSDLEGRVDLLVSNPPYVRPDAYGDLPEDVRADPYDALVGGTDVHARLATAATTWLRPGAWLLVEIGDDQGTEVRSIFERAGLEAIEVLPRPHREGPDRPRPQDPDRPVTATSAAEARRDEPLGRCRRDDVMDR